MALRRYLSPLSQFLLIIGISYVHCQTARIASGPQDQTAMYGDDVLLQCTVTGNVNTNPFKWQEFITDAAGATIFSVQTPPGQMASRPDPTKFEVIGNYNLRINNADFRDGGLYSCSVFNDATPSQAYVVVLGTPVITVGSLRDGDKTTITCEADYSNPPQDNNQHIPSMSLRIGDNIPINNAREERLEGMGRDGSTRLKMSFNYTAQGAHHDQELLCSISTVNPQYSAMERRTLDIQFPVMDVEIAPQRETYYVGEMINCTAKGNPEPTYRWEALTSFDSVGQSGPQLEITEGMIGENQWKCIASNTLFQEEFDEAIVDFTVAAALPPTDGPGEATSGGVKGWVIAVAVIVPIVIVCIFVILGILFYQRKKRSEANGPKGPGYENKEFKGSSNPVDDGVLPPDANNYGKKQPMNDYPVSMHPNPNGAPPAGKNSPSGGVPVYPPAGRDSPGFADLGAKALSGSGANLNASVDSFDDDGPPPRGPAQYSNAPGSMAPQPMPRGPPPQQQMYHGGAPDTVV